MKSTASENTLPFFLLGDFGGANGSLHHGGNLDWKHQIASIMEQRAEEVHPQFVIGLGDNFYDSGVSTIDDPKWAAQFEDFYTADALLGIPWLMCLGNHDYVGAPEAQINRTGKDPAGRWYMPSRSYSRRFDHAGTSVEVFSVDTNAISYTLTPETAGSCEFAAPVAGCSPYFERESSRIVAELERLLEESTATWKIVAGHHPLYSVGHHGSAAETAPLRQALLPLLQSYEVHLYACGHDHITQHIIPSYDSVPTLRIDSSTTSIIMPHSGHSHETESSSSDDSDRPEAVDAEPFVSHHITVGTSGAMVMPGEFKVEYEGCATDCQQLRWRSQPPAGEAAAEDFQLWYATKRRAFGTVEASLDSLRVTFVGADGRSLYTFTRGI